MTICPDCGEACAHEWCGFCERVLPQFSALPSDAAGIYTAAPTVRRCAFEKCDDPQCYWCVVLPQRFHVEPCGRPVDAGPKKGSRPCRLERGHHGPCKPSTKRQVEDSGGEDAWWT